MNGGSPGNETPMFAMFTERAVICFQEKYASDILAPLGLTKGTGYFGPKSREKANALLQEARAKRDEAGETYAEYMKAYEKSREQHVTTLKEQLTRLLVLVEEVKEVGEQIKDNVNTTCNCFSPKEGVFQEVGSCRKLVELIVNEVNTWLHPVKVY